MFNLLYQAIQLITQTLIDLCVVMVCLRILLHWANVSYANPILLAISRITNPFLKPIYSIVPTVNGLDLASVILLSFLSTSRVATLFWWETGYVPLSKGLFILALAEVIKQFFDIFFFVAMLSGMVSWFNPMVAPALAEIVFKIGDPLFRLARKVFPTVSGIDFSPVFVMLGLKLLTLFISNPLAQIGLTLIKTS